MRILILASLLMAGFPVLNFKIQVNHLEKYPGDTTAETEKENCSE